MRDPEPRSTAMKVVRVYHSGVVNAWRRRDAELRAVGVGVTLVSARRWNEGGVDVTLEARPGEDVVGVRTWGRHPYGFVFDPRPLWRVLRSDRVDVLDLHEEAASLAVAEALVVAWWAGRGRVPVCLYAAQNIEKRYPPPFRWLERHALRRASGVHTCNGEAGRILRRKGFTGRIVDLGLGVDVERFAPGPDGGSGEASSGGTGEGSGHFTVGYVGRLEAHKGVDVLVDAAARVPGLRVRIVGDGPARSALEARIANRGMGDRVRVEGYVDHDELPALYRSFDVLAVPSLETPSWVEQFGRVTVEAMASGVVVVASDSGSLPEVLDGAGVLVAPGDAAGLADAFVALRDDPMRRRELAAAGVARAAHFAWSAIALRQRAFYEDLKP